MGPTILLVATKTPEKFVNQATKVFRDFGYKTDAPPRASDVGVDFVATDTNGVRWAVQLKYHKGKPISASEAMKTAFSLRYAQDVLDASGAILVVDGPASDFARELASKAGVSLITLSDVAVATPTQEMPVEEVEGTAGLQQGATTSTTVPELQVEEPTIALSRDTDLTKRLRALPCGLDAWSEFEDLAVEILNHLFIPPLGVPKVQSVSDDGLNRRDAVYKIGYGDAFWNAIRNDCRTRFLVAEFKNSCDPPDQGDVASISKYLWGDGLRSFGLLCARRKPGKSALTARRKAWTKDRVLIVFLDDHDLAEMLKLKADMEDPTTILDGHVDEFLSTVEA